jgi:3-oxoadipate enol-lactonase
VALFDSRSWIDSVDVPTAVVLTERDQTVQPHRQRQMAAAIPGARVFPVNGRHDVCAVRPERFNEALVPACLDVSGRVDRPTISS